jgi:hypothetical protein
MAIIRFYHEIYKNDKQIARWYNLDDYTKVYISWLGRYNPRGIQPAEFSECRYWMMDQLESEIIIKEQNEGIGSQIFFYFLADEDLLKFKLSTWGAKAAQWLPDKY